MKSDSPQITAIKLKYQQSFPEKVQLVNEHLEAYLGSEESVTLTETREMLHKLAGSSGMYGYDDISTVCRSAMGKIDNDDLTALIRRLEHLKDLLQQYA